MGVAAPLPSIMVEFLKQPRVRIFFLTFWCYGSLHITRKAFSGSKPSLKSEYGLNEDHLAYLDTAFLTCYAVGMLGLGHIGDHINPSRIVSAGLFGTALCNFIFGALRYTKHTASFGIMVSNVLTFERSLYIITSLFLLFLFAARSRSGA